MLALVKCGPGKRSFNNNLHSITAIIIILIITIYIIIIIIIITMYYHYYIIVPCGGGCKNTSTVFPVDRKR